MCPWEGSSVCVGTDDTTFTMKRSRRDPAGAVQNEGMHHGKGRQDRADRRPGRTVPGGCGASEHRERCGRGE